MSSIRRSIHWRLRMPSSISAMSTTTRVWACSESPAYRQSAWPRRLERFVQRRHAMRVEVVITSTIFSAEGYKSSTHSLTTCAKSLRVRRPVTFTCRLPAKGSKIHKQARRAVADVFVIFSRRRPGAAGTGVRVSPISCLLASSRHTCGRLGSYGRWYTSSTSPSCTRTPRWPWRNTPLIL